MTKLFVALRVDHFLQRQLLEITFATNLNTEPVEGRDKRHHGLSARRRMNRQPRSYIQQILATLIWVVTVVLGLTTFDVTAADWPEHLTLHEESRSPDGHYGIVVTTSSHVDDAMTFLIPEEGEEFVDYFADLQTHRLLGKIKNFEYVEGENHRHLEVEWAPDSSLCVASDWDRYGFAAAVVLKSKGDSFSQVEIGQHIKKSIDGVIKRQSHDVTAEVYAEFYIESGPRIRVYATASNNPKQLEDVKTYYALFQGTFDAHSRKWIASSARALTAKENELLEHASENYFDEYLVVSPEAFKDLPAAEEPMLSDGKMLFRSDETKFKYLDEHMNDVYKATHLLLLPAEFAKVKQDQIAWLKKRDASNSAAEKYELTEERIEALQQLVRPNRKKAKQQ
jgi:uncharacterized protein YecT (DUF1311 family)